MIDINELRDGVSKFGGGYLTDSGWSDLIDRLEAAEKAVTEAYQRGYATGQEEIAAELEFAKREVANLHDDIHELTDERDALRAKVAELERQAPVAHVWRCDNGHIHGSSERFLPTGTKLYALPGATNPGCGEAGHDEGRCGNAQCLPGAKGEKK